MLPTTSGKRSLERGVSIQGEIKTWAVLFRYLRANGRPVDFSDYNYVEFTAWGKGQMRVLFEKESIKTSDHYHTIVNLQSEPKRFRIEFDDLRLANGTGRLTAEDLVLISFYVIGEQGRSTNFDVNVSELRFGGAEGDRLREVPDEIVLKQNYPNPFNPTTSIEFGINEAGLVRLEVFDMLGRRIATLVNTHMNEGRYTVPFDASRLASGAYLYRIIAGHRTQHKMMTVLK